MLRILCFIKSFFYTISHVKSEDNISDILTRDILPKEVHERETYDEIFSSDQDKYVFLHKLTKLAKAQQSTEGDGPEECCSWEEHPLQIMSLMSETTRSHWFPTEPIEEDDSVYCVSEEEHSSERGADLSVLVTTQSQARQDLMKNLTLQDIDQKRKDSNTSNKPDVSPSDTKQISKQGPLRIHQVFPFPDFDPIDEENDNATPVVKARKVPGMVEPHLPSECMGQIEEDQVQFDASKWRERQLKDDYFAPIIKYLEIGELPEKPHRKAK